MEALVHLGSAAAASVVSALVSAIWEGAVLAACVYVCLRLLPGLSAAARSLVWLNVFVLLVFLHGVPAFGTGAGSAIGAHHAPLQLSLTWSLAILGIWVSLSLLRGFQLIYSAVRSHGMAKRATPVEVEPAVGALLCVRGVSGGRRAELCTSREVERPSVFGFFRPRILIPPALLERLTAAELQQVVLHEMEHLRRGDDWTNLLQKVMLVLFPLNPVLLWVERRLCAERELACDDSVLRSSGARKGYAICLTRLAEYSMLRRSFTLVLGAWERQSELVRRVHRILRRPKEGISRGQTVVLTSSLMVGVVGCALGLSRSPQVVSFSVPEASEQALLQAPSVGASNAAQRGFEAHPQLVNAVMPERTSQGAFLHAGTGEVRKPAARPVSLRNVRRKRPSPAQAWVLMTAWNDADLAPSVVLTVAQVDPQGHQDQMVKRGSQGNQASGKRFAGDRMAVEPGEPNRATFAAVPFGNGWLLIQI